MLGILDVTALQRFDNGVWHDVQVDSNAARSGTEIDLTDFPEDQRVGADYRVCNRNGVGDACTTDMPVTFSYTPIVSCPVFGNPTSLMCGICIAYMTN